MFLWRNKQNYPLIITKYPPYLFHCNIYGKQCLDIYQKLDTDQLQLFLSSKCNFKIHDLSELCRPRSDCSSWSTLFAIPSTIKPDLKTTPIKRPPVLRDHFQIFPRVITIILTHIIRDHVFLNQKTRDHFYASKFCY